MLGECQIKLKKFPSASKILQVVHKGRVDIGADITDINKTKRLLETARRGGKRTVVYNYGVKTKPRSVSPQEKSPDKEQAPAYRGRPLFYFPG
jgi:hypothetical protein